MSTIVQYECRDPDHLRAGSRRGNGGLVIHHGSVGYCDGQQVEGAHHWIATGGVPIEFLLRGRRGNRPGHVSRGDLHVGVKLPDPTGPPLRRP